MDTLLPMPKTDLNKQQFHNSLSDINISNCVKTLWTQCAIDDYFQVVSISLSDYVNWVSISSGKYLNIYVLFVKLISYASELGVAASPTMTLFLSLSFCFISSFPMLYTFSPHRLIVTENRYVRTRRNMLLA